MNNELQFGPYEVDGVAYKLARLNLGRYQTWLRLYTSLPLPTLYAAWANFQSAIQAEADKTGAVEGEEVEMEIPTDVSIGLSEAMLAVLSQAENTDLLLEIAAIALDIEQSVADTFHYSIGLEVIEDFFTANPSLLADTIAFLAGTIQPTSRSSQIQFLPAAVRAKRNSARHSTGSSEKPKGGLGERLRTWNQNRKAKSTK